MDDPAGGKSTTGKMIADALREMGILALVFGLLDSFFEHRLVVPSIVVWSVFVVVCSLSLFFAGVLIERYR